MITTIGLLPICHQTVMILLTLLPMLYITSPWLIYVKTGRVYLLFPFTFFIHSSHPFPLAIGLFTVSMSLFVLFLICIVFKWKPTHVDSSPFKIWIVDSYNLHVSFNMTLCRGSHIYYSLYTVSLIAFVKVVIIELFICLFDFP